MGFSVGGPDHVIRHLREAKQIEYDGNYYDILAEKGEFLAFFRPGRSVYKAQIGSEYEPARMFFAKFTSPTDDEIRTIKILLETPIRRR